MEEIGFKKLKHRPKQTEEYLFILFMLAKII